MKLFELPFSAARDDAGRILVRSLSLRAPVRVVADETGLRRMKWLVWLLWAAWIAIILGGVVLQWRDELDQGLHIGAVLASGALGYMVFLAVLRRMPEAGRFPDAALVQAFDLAVKGHAVLRRQGLHLRMSGFAILALLVITVLAAFWFSPPEEPVWPPPLFAFLVTHAILLVIGGGNTIWLADEIARQG